MSSKKPFGITIPGVAKINSKTIMAAIVFTIGGLINAFLHGDVVVHIVTVLNFVLNNQDLVGSILPEEFVRWTVPMITALLGYLRYRNSSGDKPTSAP